jgi:hypothetical protein
MKLAKGDKVRFEYYDHDKEKEVSGVGKVKDIEPENGVIHIQTTRILHWMEYDEQLNNITKYVKA